MIYFYVAKQQKCFETFELLNNNNLTYTCGFSRTDNKETVGVLQLI